MKQSVLHADCYGSMGEGTPKGNCFLVVEAGGLGNLWRQWWWWIALWNWVSTDRNVKDHNVFLPALHVFGHSLHVFGHTVIDCSVKSSVKSCSTLRCPVYLSTCIHCIYVYPPPCLLWTSLSPPPGICTCCSLTTTTSHQITGSSTRRRTRCLSSGRTTRTSPTKITHQPSQGLTCPRSIVVSGENPENYCLRWHYFPLSILFDSYPPYEPTAWLVQQHPLWARRRFNSTWSPQS